MAKRQRSRTHHNHRPRRRPYRALYLLAGQLGVRLNRSFRADPLAATEYFTAAIAVRNAAIHTVTPGATPGTYSHRWTFPSAPLDKPDPIEPVAPDA